VVVIEGFKEIFLTMRQTNKTEQLVKFLIKMKRENKINGNNLMSLDKWVRMKADVVGQAHKTMGS
jgi:hypothetical protein